MHWVSHLSLQSWVLWAGKMEGLQAQEPFLVNWQSFLILSKPVSWGESELGLREYLEVEVQVRVLAEEGLRSESRHFVNPE